jgi:hypothetical protein
MQEGLQQHRFKYLVSGSILPWLDSAVKKEVILAGRLRCARMAVAIERYRLAHEGKLPSLSELVPHYLGDLPRDPANGEPLHYEINSSKGYRILNAATTKVFREGTTSTNLTDVAFTVAR